MIGLGVGIDYALFIVTRFREQLHKGDDIKPAVTAALDTAGRSVAFAGTTVVISLLGMLLMQISFISGLAIGAAVVVLMTMVASLTLLPALLGFAGNRVELTRWRGLIAASLVAIALVGVGLAIQPLLIGLPLAAVVLLASLAVRPLRQPVPRPAVKPRQETLAYRWSRFVQHYPWPSAIGATLLLVLLALPVLGLRLGFSDEGNYAEETTTRKAYDLLAEGFGPGFNGPLMVVGEVPAGTSQATLQAVTDGIARDPGVQFASPPVLNDPDAPTAALWRVIPTTSPQEEATTHLVERLREDVLPAATADTGLDVSVTGTVAIQVDFSTYLASRLPLFFGAVLALSFLLLMTVFRSVLVPLKAVIMNLLSIGAAFGIVVAVFQKGWGAGLLGIDGAPIEPFVPMMLFAIVFGLSMDYEVFLLSRVREEWKRTGDSRLSVADGLAATARVITAAALIMVFVFGSFLLEADRISKLFGLGLAVAVLHRRHRRPAPPGARHHGAPGRQELVAAEVARQDPARRRRRGPRPRPAARQGFSRFGRTGRLEDERQQSCSRHGEQDVVDAATCRSLHDGEGGGDAEDGRHRARREVAAGGQRACGEHDGDGQEAGAAGVGLVRSEQPVGPPPPSQAGGAGGGVAQAHHQHAERVWHLMGEQGRGQQHAEREPHLSPGLPLDAVHRREEAHPPRHDHERDEQQGEHHDRPERHDQRQAGGGHARRDVGQLARLLGSELPAPARRLGPGQQGDEEAAGAGDDQCLAGELHVRQYGRMRAAGTWWRWATVLA